MENSHSEEPNRTRSVAPLAVALLLPFAASADAQRVDPYADARSQMVEEYLVAEGIDDKRVLEAMRSVPRHEFVRPSLRRLAYVDQALDIGYKQTISPPYIVAYMTQMLAPQPDDRVLEVGTGSGYQAAVLSGLVKEVYTIEIVEPLGKQAAARLRKLGYDNVHVRIGDGYPGWPEQAPFDRIIVTCSPESVPQPLADQLKEGGRMIIPLGERYQQVFHLLEKRDGKLIATQLQPTLFVPMTGRSEQQRQVKPDPAHPEIINGGFENANTDTGRVRNWHYQRRATVKTDDAPAGRQYLCFHNDEPGAPAHVLQAFAIDGEQVGSMTLSTQYRSAGVRAGRTLSERPSLIVHFYDANRLPIERGTVGPWRSHTSGWTTADERITVPARAREAILQVGLNGATGTLCVDEISMTRHLR